MSVFSPQIRPEIILCQLLDSDLQQPLEEGWDRVLSDLFEASVGFTAIIVNRRVNVHQVLFYGIILLTLYCQVFNK